MKCKECNYENPDDALCCGLCGHKFRDESTPPSSVSSLNEPRQEQLNNSDGKLSRFESIKNFFSDNKILVVICIGLLSFYIFFSVRSFLRAQKYQDFENKVAELSYPIYVDLVTGKEADLEENRAKLQNFMQDYANHSGPKEFQAIMAAIQRGQEKARKKVKRDFNVRCPFF